MTTAVVPFKNLDGAKERLSGRLEKDERQSLVLAMVEDVLGTLSRVKGLSGLMVVTREPRIADRAAAYGAEILDEPANDGHTAAVERAVRTLETRRAQAMLCVAGDIPGATEDEIAAMLRALGPPPSVVLVPSRDERGTNAVLVSPPGGLPLRFGEPSFMSHLTRAKELGLRTEVLRLSGLGLDIDTPEDLGIFLETPSNTATYRLLARRERP
jgi:2-phospho-L-lactate guanylyltransferase